MLIEFKKVNYTYPCSQNPALDNLNLGIKANQRTCLIGRNGCGKSTLFRLANGLFIPDKGRIEFLGKPISYHPKAIKELRTRVGLVFQDPQQQLVGTTVAEDISYGLCNLGLPKSEIIARVNRILTKFELLELAYTPINYLSLGQKKRVSLADVMVLEPDILLLDEPTAYLDTHQTQNLFLMLDKIRNQGTTIVIATHDLNLAFAWADWVLVMDNGQLIAEGTPEEIFTNTQMLWQLGLGVPLAVELLATVKAEISLSEFQIQALTEKLLQACQGRI